MAPVVIIPARIDSTRFPRKLLYPILGKPLILWTAEGAMRSQSARRVIVATDSEEILRVCVDAGVEAVMTRADHRSGTDRVWEVAERLDSDWIVNLQGDEPLVTGEVLDTLVAAASGEQSDGLEMATLVRKLDREEAGNPNKVKVVTDLCGNALYFSRAPIPYLRITGNEPKLVPSFLLHIGVYLYRRDILERLVSYEQTPLEKTECLEQLRALEKGIRIRCVHTSHEFLGVDTLADVPRVEAVLRARQVEGKEELG